jgi:hypothetical protein
LRRVRLNIGSGLVARGLEQAISEEALLVPLFHEQVNRFARSEVEGLALSYWSLVAYENLSVRRR